MNARSMFARTGGVAIAAALALAPAPVAAQWSRVYEQYYLPAEHNWVFRGTYPAADRLFNAFDYGHAILYETLWTRPGAPAARLEEREFDFLTRKLLVSPPRLPLEEMAIEPMYSRLAPEAKAMFEWAHLLHRQLYDILADERIPDAARDAKVEEVLRYYLSRRDVAFSVRPKSMALMQEQPYSLAFRQRYPKFNGLIWGYHWLQIGLYEPLLEGNTLAERQAGVAATLARFRQIIADAPGSTPYVMPMTPAVAPRFAARYPQAAIIFDNLHSMHDVISDILANPAVPRDRKRHEILLAASRYRDDTTEVMSVEGWRKMSAMMGVQNLGGVASSLVTELPTPTVQRGAVMRHDREGNMIGDDHAGHDMSAMAKAPERTVRAERDEHAGHDMPDRSPAANDSALVAAAVQRFHQSLAAGDSAQALSLLTEDVAIQEGGGVESKDAYRRGHLAGDIAFARAVPSERSPVAVTVRGDVAWARSSSTTVGEYRGRRIDSAGAELMVLVRQGGAWRISAIHWSSRNRAPR